MPAISRLGGATIYRAQDEPPVAPEEVAADEVPAQAVSLAGIRSWAKEQGLAVSERGRVSAAVVDAYNAAMSAEE